ncbi:MAG TPA: energy transducer TonB [Blastocatellia bacterium]|nr:energy transducer TonB [Blastocatellia bacterium]
MKTHVAIIALLLCAMSAGPLAFGRGAAARQSLLRVAVVGFSGQQGSDEALQAALRAALAQNSRVALIDPAQIKPAVAGLGYDGSVNLSRDEARRLGGAIGCDFFIVGKRDAFTRSDAKQESHEEALVGVMIVDARTGELAAFDFINEKAASRDAALRALTATLSARAAMYVERMAAHRAGRDAARDSASVAERVEDLPDAESAAAAGFTPPQFLNRVRPDYTDEAERADITATVEAAAVFRADGTVGQIEVTRWAGFGLDEAAARAIRQLKFKPAARDGRPISVRATVRYNFRRLSEPAQQPAPIESPAERPVPDLRKYFPSPYRPPRRL